MRVIAKSTLRAYYTKNAGSEIALEDWYKRVSKMLWENHNDLKECFPSADYVGGERYVFNIKGNNYRLVIVVKFKEKIIYIRWVGTHAEYDKINVKTI